LPAIRSAEKKGGGEPPFKGEVKTGVTDALLALFNLLNMANHYILLSHFAITKGGAFHGATDVDTNAVYINGFGGAGPHPTR
jgi:hypothetical protein